MLLVKATYSRWFPDFMFDSKREADAFLLDDAEGSFSVWDYVAHNLHLFRNVVYKYHPESLTMDDSSEVQLILPCAGGLAACDTSAALSQPTSPELPTTAAGDLPIPSKRKPAALLTSGSFWILRDHRGTMLSFDNQFPDGKPGHRVTSDSPRSRVTDCLNEASDAEDEAEGEAEAEAEREKEREKEGELLANESQRKRGGKEWCDATQLMEKIVHRHTGLSDLDTESPESQLSSPAVLERLKQFPVRLILPRVEVPYLGIWEAVHYRGLPVVSKPCRKSICSHVCSRDHTPAGNLERSWR